MKAEMSVVDERSYRDLVQWHQDGVLGLACRRYTSFSDLGKGVERDQLTGINSQ